MARQSPTPAEAVSQDLDMLAVLVRNLLVDNVNFRSPDGRTEAHHFRETPRTGDFVRKELRGMAQSILERIDSSRDLAMHMAADAAVPGLHRTHSGHIHDFDVHLAERDGGWHATLSVPGAFHGGDDREASFPDETSALSALREFSLTGIVPEAFVPVPGYGAAGPR